MSKKVVHLSDVAHTKAKEFCKDNGLKMSDWVASLIDEAVAKNRTDTTVRTFVPKKKSLKRLEEAVVVEEEATTMPPWSQPPFWAQQNAGG